MQVLSFRAPTRLLGMFRRNPSMCIFLLLEQRSVNSFTSLRIILPKRHQVAQTELDRIRGSYEEERKRRESELRERHQVVQLRKQMKAHEDRYCRSSLPHCSPHLRRLLSFFQANTFPCFTLVYQNEEPC